MVHLHWINLAKNGVELREREKNDYYPTNIEHAKKMVELLSAKNPQWILDAGMGNGIFGQVLKERYTSAQLIGVELRLDAPFMKWYDWNIRANFLEMNNAPDFFDIVIGNPPYKLATEFAEKSFDMLKAGGQLIYLLRLSYLESLSRYQLFKNSMPLKQVFVCSDRPDFLGQDKGGAEAYAFFLWEKGYEGDCIIDWVISRPRNEKYQHFQPKLF